VKRSSRLSIQFALIGCLCACAESARGQHQTADLTPIQLNSALPYQISLQEYDFGATALPTLHSFNAAHYDGKWVVFAGRTNGMHGFEDLGPGNFPPSAQNKEVWVIDPVTKQAWSRSLDSASGGLTAAELRSLTPANTQYYQRGDQLYVTGGYGVLVDSGGGNTSNGTFNTLTAVDLPGIMDWVVNNNGTAKSQIRQITSSQLRVTGGAMYEIGGRTHLVFGQNFTGNYGPTTNGTYTNQVRSFTIVDDGTNLSIANLVASTPIPEYRRRDLNVFPVVRPDTGSGLEEEIVVLSGVFTPPPQNGAWTVPVEIDPDGLTVNVTMDDPNAPDTFKQGFNGYHSAKLGMFSEDTGAMHEILFGGISVQTLDTATQTVVTDNNMPFINDITSVIIDANGDYSQHWIGEYPIIHHFDNMGVDRGRLRFGANAEFFLAEGVETYENGVIKLDQLTQPTLLGYIYGGLYSNSPHTRGVEGAISGASKRVFAVMFTPVPEPTTAAVLLSGLLTGAMCRRRARRNELRN
jgi:hypothetical protein